MERAPRALPSATLPSLALLVVLTGCPQRPDAQRPVSAPSAPARPAPVAAGSSCRATFDCPEGQLCVGAVCRYAQSSVAGEVLATAARALAAQGDEAGAARLYGEAVEAFATRRRPVPPELLCAAAASALRAARTTDERERAAKRADDCFRNSLPGAPEREPVRQALTRLRYEGLDLAHFDEPSPAGRFFTREPQRPTLDAVEVAIELPDVDAPGFDRVAEIFRSPEATRAVADCFVKGWGARHERAARGALVVQLQSRLRDMGYYDVYEANVRVAPGGGEKASDFERCTAEALQKLLAERLKRRIGRVVSWKQAVEVSARLQ